MSWQLLFGDCRSQLLMLPPGSIDLVLTDPPYGETSLAWDRWPPGWMTLLPRLMALHASLWMFGSQRMFMERADEIRIAGFRIVQDLVWEKHNGSGFLTDRFRRVHEHAVQFRLESTPWAQIYKRPLYTQDAVARTVRNKSKPAHWTGARGATVYESKDGGPRLMRSVLHAPSEHGRALHPTQKPLSCLLPLIEYSVAPGGMVLDPFGGSGSTAVACKQSGRDCILIEADAAYVEIARQRLLDDAPLFGAAE